MSTERALTTELRPGDVVATADDRYRRHGGVKRLHDPSLGIVVWRTVELTAGPTKYAGVCRVKFTDGSDVMVWPGEVWHRQLAEPYPVKVETLGDIYKVLQGMIDQGMAVESIRWVLDTQTAQKAGR
jgi:hypothetical protein